MTPKERILKLRELLKLEEQLLQELRKETKVVHTNTADIDKHLAELKQRKEKRRKLEKEFENIRSKITELYNSILQEMYEAGLEEIRVDIEDETLIINRKDIHLERR